MRSAEERGWIRCTVRLPEAGQTVYYFGPMIGIHIGTFDPTVQTQCCTEDEHGNLVYEEMPKHIVDRINHNKFINNHAGVVDADDAPWWMPYDPEHAKSWVPLPPDYAPAEETV
jgi:hypothetical protein